MSADFGFLSWVCPSCGQQRRAYCEDRWGQTSRYESCRWCRVGMDASPMEQYWDGFACTAKVTIIGEGRSRGILVNGKPVPSVHSMRNPFG